MTVFEIVVYHLDTIIGTVYLGAQEIFLFAMVALGTVPIKEFMIFNRQQKQVKDFNVRIDNTMIERVESFNYLSIMLNETLSWKSHNEMVGKNFQKLQGYYIDLENPLYYLHYIILLSFHILTMDIAAWD